MTEKKILIHKLCPPKWPTEWSDRWSIHLINKFDFSSKPDLLAEGEEKDKSKKERHYGIENPIAH